MLRLKMDIEQADNGWILTFIGHNCLDKRVVCHNWGGVITTLDEYFGYWVNDKWVKKE